MLRKALIATTVIVATAGAALAADVTPPIVTPGPISSPGPTLTGDLSLSLGGLWFEAVQGPTGSLGVFNTLGRVNVPLHGTWNLEVEAGGGAVFEGGEGQPYYINAVAHLWGMHSPTAAWGLYGGAVFGYGPISWTGGAEAKHFLTNGSVGVSAGVMRLCCTETLGVFTASFNHYFNPNHRIGVHGAILTDFSASTWEVSVDVEHRFMHPISVFAEASYISLPFGVSAHAWTAKGGVKFYLDAPGDTLQSHEKKVPWTTWVPNYFLLGP